ncbi:hypothetical protein [Maritalea sp.]|uniref:hypothetical protein n=1 Tax=Maritalea sp. TaxID=2003361 RepID=UPI003EF3AD82
MNNKIWLAISVLTLVFGVPSYAQESAPVPPTRPETFDNSNSSTSNPNQDITAPTAGDATDPKNNSMPQQPKGDPQPVSISARVAEDGPFIPNGVEWRIYSILPNENGELELITRSKDATASFGLAPGDYIAHASFGRAQASDTINVVEGPNQIELILNAGGLQLNAAVTGDISIPNRWLRFTVYADSAEGGQRIVAQSVAPGKVLHLNSGTYSVVSHFGDVNATAKADLRVEPGQLTSATLYHKAALATFKLVSEPGGEAIADTEWTIKTPDGVTIHEEKNAFPQTVLEQGEYILIAKLGTRVFNREFEIVPGLPREIEMLVISN